MNFVFISPHFPKNFDYFVKHLNENGVTVLGIASENYFSLSDVLKENLTEYYKVNDLENYDEVLKACGYFTHRYGKIDRIESNNEHWLELDAQLRTDFNVFGFKNEQMDVFKTKSGMKEVFIDAGIPVAAGRVIGDLEDAKDFIETIGYPVIVKPNHGVGASFTYKLENEEELEYFYMTKDHSIEFICEECLTGEIVTYDGLTNKHGEIVFDSTLSYGVTTMDINLGDTDMYYIIPPYIPEDLVECGKKIVDAFDIKERMFHIEFFRTEDDSLVAMEVNFRAPGYPTLDVMNFANDINIYEEYANVVVSDYMEKQPGREYFCAYVSTKYYSKPYVHSVEEIRERYGDKVMMVEKIPEILSRLMGDHGIIIRTPNREELGEMIDFIHAKY